MQYALDQSEHLKQRQGYVSVEPDGAGATSDPPFDRHAFRVTNASPAMVRHVALRVDDGTANTAVGPMKVDPHILQVGETGFGLLEIPHNLLSPELTLWVEWADSEQNDEWAAEDRRKERRVDFLDSISPIRQR